MTSFGVNYQYANLMPQTKQRRNSTTNVGPIDSI